MPKLGYISWDSAYGQEPLRGGKEYAEKMGVTLAPPEFFPAGSLDHTVYLSRLAKAEVNYIFVGGVDPTPTNVIRDAHKLGLTKTIQFFCDYWGPTSLGVRLHPEALEGTVIVSYYLRGDDARKHSLRQSLDEVWTWKIGGHERSLYHWNVLGNDIRGSAQNCVKTGGLQEVRR